MALNTTNNWMRTARYSAAYLAVFLLVLTSLSPSSRAASIGSTIRATTGATAGSTTGSATLPDTSESALNITQSAPNLKEAPYPPRKLTLTLRNRVRVADEQVKTDKMADQQPKVDKTQEAPPTKEVPTKEVNKAASAEKGRKGSKESSHDNIVFPKDEEPMKPTSAAPPTTVDVDNRILIGGMPNPGYGRDDDGNIVEIFE